MKSTILSILILISIHGFSQPCLVEDGLIKIEQFRAKGEFDTALKAAMALQNCNTIDETEKVKVLIAQSKIHRDNYAFGKAEIAMVTAKAILEKNRIPLDFEFKFLLAEIYAHRGNPDAYFAIIPQIKDRLFSASDKNSDDLGRYYLVSFRTTNKTTELLQGINYLQNALTEFEKVPSPPVFYYGNALRSLGNMYRVNADFDKSIFYYQKGKTFMLGHYPKNHFEIAYYDYAIGAVYYEKMEYKLALNHFLDAFEVWNKILQPDDRYMRYLNEAIGDMYWELKAPEKALYYFNLSIVGEEKINNDRSEYAINVADSLIENGNYASAIKYYEEAFKWREKEFGRNSVLTGACKNFVARAIRFSGDTEGALEAYQEAIRILVPEMTESSFYTNPTSKMQVQSYQYLLESLMSKGELLKELYSQSNNLTDLEAALQTHEIALGMLEDLKNNQMSEASREFWTNRTLNLVESSIETAVSLYQITNHKAYLSKAFNFSERSKALLLLASLYDHEIDSFANVSEAIVLKEKELKKSINEYVGKIESEEKRCSDMRTKLLSLWRNKLNSLQSEYDLLVANIKDNYPDYYTLKYDSQVAELASIQAGLLDETTALISYFTGPENTFVFYIGSNDISVRMIPNTAALFNQTIDLFTSISSLSLLRNAPQLAFDEFTQNGYQLFEKLLKPEIEKLEVTKLIISPDGKLCYLPFDSLLTKKVVSATRDYRSLPYLLKEYAVSYSPSASIRLLSENDSDIADNYLGFAPNYKGQKYPVSEASGATLSLENLYYNSREVKQAANLFQGKSHTGDDVSEDLLKTYASKVGILHLAMHGAIEDQHPLLSKLFFNPSEIDDGMLHVYEIYNMKIPAQLVILSACNTAAGKLVRGEGIVSLERAFQYAGSKALLSTLWKVDDGASLRLTESFLQNIKDGHPKDIALRDAKLQFLATALPEHQHPFYWSSFKLTGNTQPLQRKSSNKYLYFGIGLLGVVVVLIYFQKQRRKSKI